MTRLQFLVALGFGLAGGPSELVSLAAPATTETSAVGRATAKSTVTIWLTGGPSHTHPRDGRKIHALEYWLVVPPPTSQHLIVWLNYDGNDVNGRTRPEDPTKRIVNVGPGDWLVFEGSRRFQGKSVSVYR